MTKRDIPTPVLDWPDDEAALNAMMERIADDIKNGRDVTVRVTAEQVAASERRIEADKREKRNAATRRRRARRHQSTPNET